MTIVAKDHQSLTWDLLAVYEEAGGEYEVWAKVVGLDPQTVAADQAYGVTHAAYQVLWKAMGDAFHIRLWSLQAQWRSRVRQARSELANRRSFAT